MRIADSEATEALGGIVSAVCNPRHKLRFRFKSKFAPSFVEKEYVAIYPPQFKLRPILALVKAFEPNGLTGLVVSKLRKTVAQLNK